MAAVCFVQSSEFETLAIEYQLSLKKVLSGRGNFLLSEASFGMQRDQHNEHAEYNMKWANDSK